MDRDATPITIPGEDPTAVELVTAIRAGDVAAVRRLVGANPKLAGARLFARGGTRTPLHIVADWPGYFPNGPQIVAVLIDAGADPNIGTTPKPSETPLHWAASSDDADVAAALIDGGADIEIPDGSIGTPLDNAMATPAGTWPAARRRMPSRTWGRSQLGA